MKNVVIILVIMFSLAGFAQTEDVNVDTTVNPIEVKALETVVAKKAPTVKSKVFRINQQKSNDIISIKAYRKSLNVKVSTKKLC